MHFPMRKEVICRGSDDVYSFCRALKGGKHSIHIIFRMEHNSLWECSEYEMLWKCAIPFLIIFSSKIFTFSSLNNILQLCHWVIWRWYLFKCVWRYIKIFTLFRLILYIYHWLWSLFLNTTLIIFYRNSLNHNQGNRIGGIRGERKKGIKKKFIKKKTSLDFSTVFSSMSSLTFFHIDVIQRITKFQSLGP